MSENLNQWVGVSAGSRLELSVVGTNFVTRAHLVPTAGAEEWWADSSLNPGPHQFTTQAGVGYIIQIVIKFIGLADSPARVNARVIDRAGNPILDWWGDDVYEHETSGKNGDSPAIVTLMLIDE